jgi:DNA-binding MarR family transcriptional regulator
MKKTIKSDALSERSVKSNDSMGYSGIELIFYGRKGLTADADAILAGSGYGRAHFRVLYVIARNKDITTNELLLRLKITGQSLTRVMSALVRDELVTQRLDPTDRRQRLHQLSEMGAKLEHAVMDSQLALLKRAYSAAGPEAVDGFLRVLLELVPKEDRQLLSHVLEGQ